MRLDTTARRAVAVAVLLSATAVGAAPGTAQAAGSTELVFEVVDGLLGMSSVRADATDQTTVTSTDGTNVVLSQLGTVTITDNRILKLNWSYGASAADLMPVKSKEDRTARADGAKPDKSGAQFRVPSAPTGSSAATYVHQSDWKTIGGDGKASDLVRKTLGGPTTTSFPLELKIVLPGDTPAGAYRTAVTHSVS